MRGAAAGIPEAGALRPAIFVVEDDEDLRALVSFALASMGNVVLAESVAAAKSKAAACEPDLVILDVVLPDGNGLQLVDELRRTQQVHVPVLVLTGLGSGDEKVRGFDAGADDYLSKPFDLGELMARAKALIRRGKGVADPILKVGDLEINSLQQTARRGNHLLDLSPTEYRILEYLMHRPRAVVSKRELSEHLYDYDWEHHSNVIEVHISNLRRKLVEAGTGPLIETLRHRGYRLSIPKDAA